MKTYTKAGLITASGLIVLTYLAFDHDLWRTQQRESPHYRADACQVCHSGADTSGLKADELELCRSCHSDEHAEAVVVSNAEGREVRVALGQSHPFGIFVSQRSAPATLPLQNGRITCQTCHDVHMDNSASAMVRLCDSLDFTPLCHDCHPSY